MKKILILIFSLISTSTFATHLSGGNIYYKWMSGNTYEITLELYRDCVGILPDSNYTLKLTGQTSFDTLYCTVTQVGYPVPAVEFCAASFTQSSCLGGSLPGYDKYLFKGYISIPVADQWHIYFKNCCRNASITNVFQPSNVGMTLESYLDNTQSPVNNSAVFNGIPIIVLLVNQTYQISNAATDADGDSLSFSFETPLSDSANSPFVFLNPYTVNNPFSSSTPISMDAATGTISCTPNTMQIFAMSVSVSEFRNGVLVGKVYRDLQFIVINGSTNNLPQLSGINGTNNYIISGSYGQPISFTINSSDPDAGQSLQITQDSVFSNSTFTTTGGNFPTGTFQWTPAFSNVSAVPYLITFTVKDDMCPYVGIQTFTYQIFVNYFPVDTVWPGDANDDLVVNPYDVLSIGLAYGDTGASRPAASTNWIGQYCTDWNTFFSSGINHKHADCNGDGIVDTSDLNAVTLNDGLTHLKLEEPSEVNDRNLPTLSVELVESVIASGNILHGTIDLNNSGNDLTDIYGVEVELLVNNAIIDHATLHATGNGWLNNGTGFINWKKSGNGKIYLVYVRENHLGINGHGTIGQFDFLIPSGVVSAAQYINISSARVITSANEIVPVIFSNDHVQITGPNGVVIYPDFNISIFPNPAKEHLTVTANEIISTVKITDMVGRIILNIPVLDKKQAIDLSNFCAGQFIVELNVEGTIERKYFTKL